MATFLVMPLKVPPRFDVVAPLAKWLDDGTQHVGFELTNPLQLVVPKPDFKSTQCRSELLRLAALRNCLSESLMDSHKAAMQDGNALVDCMDFHATLLEFEKRGFPSSTHLEDSNGLALGWRGAFGRQQLETHATLVWDRACTLWNIAALQSALIEEAELTTKEDCKIAISNCQSAAAVLRVLQHLAETEDFATVDLAPAMISFWEKLFLAQGQICIYKMANIGDTVRQHGVLAYLLKGAAALYNEALGFAQNPRLQSEVPRQSTEWGAHCKAQSMMASAKAEFHLAVDHRMKNEWGLEIARLQQCVDYIKECQTFLASVDKKKDSSNFVKVPQVDGLSKLANDRLEKAIKDNRSVYQDDVPKHVPDIRSQIMVKTDIPLPETMLIPKVTLFANV